MLAVTRLILFVLYLIILTPWVGILCLIRPFNPKNIYHAAHLFGKSIRLFGVKIEGNFATLLPYTKTPCIYLANHQTNFDGIIASAIFPKNTLCIGKKSLFWIPFFGVLFWLLGNVLIDRENRKKSFLSLQRAIMTIKNRGFSVWVFPEGTRNHGKGLRPFKTGALHMAQYAEVPIIPVCISSYEIKLNRRNNGVIRIESLAAIPALTTLVALDSDKKTSKSTFLHQAAHVLRTQMANKIAELDSKIAVPDSVKS